MSDPPGPSDFTDRPPRAVEHEPAAADAVFTRQGSVWCEASRLSDSIFRMRFGGLFDTAWAAALCSAVAKHRISIEHAHARLGQDGHWIAEFHVVALEGAADPRTLPLLEFAKAERPEADAPLVLEAARVIESQAHGGTLVLTVEAMDSLGLLGALLALVTRVPLVPVEMHIETRDARIYDSLWLGGPDGATPSSIARETLERLLAPTIAESSP